MAVYTGPNGWTADSVVGAINAAAQAPITAQSLLTEKGKAKDPALESRKFLNAYTGVRDPALVGSVYAQADTPAWLAGEVSALNAEQALRRSAQAEIFNRVFQQAENGGDASLPWLEVLRAAVLQPGVEAGFGSSVVDPNVGRAALESAQAQKTAAGAYANALNAPISLRQQVIQNQSKQPTGLFNPLNTSSGRGLNEANALKTGLVGAERVAQSVLGTNPFAASQGYITPGSNSGGYGVVRPPATSQAYPWGGGYVGPTQFSIDNPSYNLYAGSNFLTR